MVEYAKPFRWRLVRIMRNSALLRCEAATVDGEWVQIEEDDAMVRAAAALLPQWPHCPECGGCDFASERHNANIICTCHGDPTRDPACSAVWCPQTGEVWATRPAADTETPRSEEPTHQKVTP